MKFHEITRFTLTLHVKVPRSENSEKSSEESRLFTRANLVLRPALSVLRPALNATFQGTKNTEKSSTNRTLGSCSKICHEFMTGREDAGTPN